MTRSRITKVTFGSLVILLLCSVAVTPLLRDSIPCTHDGGLHYFRTAALKHAFEQGILFSRWLPDLAFGYGFPFFNYRAPLSYYLTLGLHLAGLSLPWTLNLIYALSILGSALGAYLFARDLFGAPAGILAGVAYAYAPYQFLDALVRGNAPESVALALLPFILWAFRRLALRGGRRWFVTSVALLAALYLGHNISSLLFTPFLLAYLAMLWLVYPGERHWKWAALAFLLALGLTAFFWFPALAEQDYVQLYLTGATRSNDFHHNFVSLSEILAPPKALDTSLINPPLKIKLGLTHVVLASVSLLLGLVLFWNPARARALLNSQEEISSAAGLRGRDVKEQRASLLFFAGCASLFVFMSTSSSVWLWERVPLLPFVQFPWRFVGRASLPIALLAGVPLLGLLIDTAVRTCGFSRAGPLARHLLSSILVGFLILAALPSMYAPGGYCPMAPYPTVEDVHRYERESGLVGVDPVGAYFPVWVQDRPEGSPLEMQYADDGTVARFDVSALPQTAQVLDADYGGNRARVVVDSPEAFQARYLTFYFPGWRVEVDDEPVAITPSDPEGLITFDVPAGRHTIEIRFGETPLRLAADVVSALALVGLIASVVLSPRSGVSPSCQDSRPDTGRLKPVFPLLTVALLLAFKLAVVDRVPTPFRHPELQPDGALPGVQHSLQRSYADGLKLIGYDQSASEMPADDTLRVDLYWGVQEQPSRRYQTVIHLVGSNGFRWSRHDTFRPRDYQDPPPTYAWTPGRYALDSHGIEPLPGTPPGRYDVVVAVFDRETLAPLSVLNEQGQPAAPELTLGQVTLTAPRQPIDPGRLEIGHRLGQGGSPGIRLGPVALLGADFDRDQAAPGDPVLATTFWRAHEKPEKDLTLHLALLSRHGSPVAQYTGSPVADWHPTSIWQPGDVWRGQGRFYLPADLDTGTYTWTLSLAPSPSPPISLSQLSVTAPQRTFTEPAMDIEIDTPLDGIATLEGANVSPEISDLEPGTTMTVTLFWRAEAETHVSYRVFLHLIGPKGALIAQSDGVPANWTRPTTGWLAGEVISDVRTLTIPTDAPTGDACPGYDGCGHTIYAGLYTVEGGRLVTPHGADAILVTTVTVKR